MPIESMTSLPACFSSSFWQVWECIPETLRPGLWRYFTERVLPGAFLRAVLENNFSEALNRAGDGISRDTLFALSRLLQGAPSASWGSKTVVDAWAMRRG